MLQESEKRLEQKELIFSEEKESIRRENSLKIEFIESRYSNLKQKS